MPDRRAAWFSALMLLAYGLPAAAACTPIEPRNRDAEALALLEDSESGAADRSTGMFHYRPDVVPLEIGDRLPGYDMEDTHGDPFSFAAMRGKTVVVTFFETRSPDAALCPALLVRLGELRHALRSGLQDEVVLVAVTVDPEHDTPAVVRDWALQAGVDTSLRFLRATPETTSRLATNLGLVLWRRDDGSIGHSLGTVVIDRRGRLADTFPGVTGWSTMDLLASVVAITAF